MRKVNKASAPGARAQLIANERDGVWHVSDGRSSAKVLMPKGFKLEDKAVEQLLAFAAVRSPDGERGASCACATPDFHPGSLAPVGAIVGTSAGFAIPAAIGTDINCGMRLITTGLSLAQFELHQERLVKLLTQSLLHGGRDLPLDPRHFAALFESGAEAFIEELGAKAPGGQWASMDRARLAAEIQACVGLADFKGGLEHAPEAYKGKRESFRDPGLGTIGSGNHFVEFQVVERLLDGALAWRSGLKKGDVVAMIHSGSRDFGFHVGGQWMDRARDAWPAGQKHPESKLYGVEGEACERYLQAMGCAARYAWLNRVALAELARDALERCVGAGASRLITDVSHNVITQEGGINVHRKGATMAQAGQWALIPGSMGDASFLVEGLGNPDWLSSCSHGAGRSVRRQAMRAKKLPVIDPSNQRWRCVTLKEERLVEEAPSAYKPIGPVISSQEEAGLIKAAVEFRPLLTFKA